MKEKICKNCPNCNIPEKNKNVPSTMHDNRGYCRVWLGYVDLDETCEWFGNTSKDAFKIAQGL